MAGKALSPAQRACLADADRGPLVRTVAGWGLIGKSAWHAAQTIDALAGRGLLAVTNRNSVRGRKARATITAAGVDTLGRVRAREEVTDA